MKKYAISVAIVLIAAVIQFLIYPWIGPAPYILFYPAVIAAALLGDGIIATVLSLLIAQYLFVGSGDSLRFEWPQGLLTPLLFLISSFSMVYIINSLRRAQAKASSTAHELAAEVIKSRRSADSHQFLAEASGEIYRSLNLEETLTVISRLAVPKLADWTGVYVRSGDQLKFHSSTFVNDAIRLAFERMQERFPVEKNPKSPVSETFRTGKPSLLNLDERVYRSIAQSEEHYRLLSEVAPHSMIQMPIVIRGRVEGVITTVTGPSARRYGEADLAVCQEIANRAAFAIEHAQAYTQAQNAIQTREEVLGVVSHDLRNPLGSILMNVGLLKRKPQHDREICLSHLNRIEQAGQRMNQMIEDLLNLSKIEAGTFSITRRESCGCDIVKEAIEMIRPLAEEKQIRIEVEGIEQPLSMACDHVQVLRVFSNLIGNAIKFTPEHGLIKVIAEDRESEVLFSVMDTGPGIAEHHVPYIFDRFWQGKRTSQQGAGLGLAITKGIVEAHGGRVWVKSQFGRGATFSFSLPKLGAKERVA